MEKVGRRIFGAVLLSFAVGLAGGCGGEGGGGGGSDSAGNGSALRVAEKVSVVDAQSSTARAVPLRLGRQLFLTTADIPATSNYFTDTQTIYVHEGSAQAFNTVNEILCMMAQAKYDSMINRGAYKAQIDKNKCSKNSDSASGAGQSSQNQSSGSTAPNYESWTVVSSRADNSSPHIVKVWVHEDADGMEPAKVILVKAEITEAASSTNPYGIFRMDFEGQNSSTGAVMFKGFMKTEKDPVTGKVLLYFIDEGSMGGTFSEAVVLDRTTDGSSGKGTTSTTQGSSTAQFDIAFNSSNFLKRDSTLANKCFSRTSFDETAWRYGLYDSTGTRVNINSGFPIRKGTAYGWIGYYGLWFPESTAVSDGDTVYKLAFGSAETPYTVVKKGGKLKKHTKHAVTLADVKNIPMDGWMEGGNNFRVRWDGTQFVKFARLNQTTFMWENIAPAAISLASLNFGELNFWSQAIGGQVRVKLQNCTWNGGTTSCDAPTNATQVVYFSEDVMYPGDTVPATLRCYDNCPKGGATGLDPNDPAYAPDYSPTATGHNYTFNSASSDMILKDGGNPTTMATAPTSGQYQWGFMSGPLFEPSAGNLALLACDWNPAQTCGWKAWGAFSVYYTWETGPKDWNQFTALTSGASVQRFDAPLQVAYTHSQTDSTKLDYKYNGTKFYLEYNGFGNLWGIPGACVDEETGQPTSCGPGTRWIAEFTVPDGSELSNSNSPTTKYLLKALEKEQRMSKLADLSGCSGLTLSTYTLPSISEWTSPGIGAEPSTGAPAVIGGVLQ